MINPSDERISALVDGELDRQEHQTVVGELLTHGESRKAWGRYHLIGDTLKRSLPEGIDHDFSSRVMAALDNEPTVLAPPSPIKSSWRQRVAGLAVAASVTAVAVLGVQFTYQQDGQILTPEMVEAPTGLLPLPRPLQNVARTSVQQPPLGANIQTVVAGPSATTNHIPGQATGVHSRLNKYLVNHYQQAPRAVVKGIIPDARIVAYPNSYRFLIQTQE